jgi:hypothetical protein
MIEELVDGHLQLKLALAGKDSDLQQADRAQREWLRLSNRSLKRPHLLS